VTPLVPRPTAGYAWLEGSKGFSAGRDATISSGRHGASGCSNQLATDARPPAYLSTRWAQDTRTYTRIHTHAAMDNLGKISAFGKTFSYVRVTAKCRRRHRPQAARLAERETHIG
jgi:hypothetical protein